MKPDHAWRLVSFNRPLYVLGGTVFLGGVAIAAVPLLPGAIRCGAALAALAAGWLTLASFTAFHWMFDRSELLGGTWLHAAVERPWRRVLGLHAGLDQTTLPLDALFPGAEVRVLDVYDPAVMTEPALARARGQIASPPVARGLPSLPLTDGWADGAVVMLAAHEIRDAERRARLFDELNRVCAAGADVVLVEHLRNVAALLAFGPGIGHFFPRREWLRLAARARWRLRSERAITPFVQVFFFQTAAAAGD